MGPGPLRRHHLRPADRATGLTGKDDATRHLRRADFFDVDNTPTSPSPVVLEPWVTSRSRRWPIDQGADPSIPLTCATWANWGRRSVRMGEPRRHSPNASSRGGRPDAFAWPGSTMPGGGVVVSRDRADPRRRVCARHSRGRAETTTANRRTARIGKERARDAVRQEAVERYRATDGEEARLDGTTTLLLRHWRHSARSAPAVLPALGDDYLVVASTAGRTHGLSQPRPTGSGGPVKETALRAGRDAAEREAACGAR